MKEKKIFISGKIIGELIDQYAEKGDSILDTHVGSGSSGSSRLASFDLGFSFTGFELSKIHHARQEKRFSDHKAQLRLFI